VAIILHIINSAMSIATLAMIYGAIQRSSLGFRVRHIALGICFGLGAVVGMLQPLSLGPHAIVDARALFLGFAGAFLSPLGAFTALVVAVLGRIAININSYTFVGIASIIIAVVMGGLWPEVRSRLRLSGTLALLVLGAMISLSLFGAYLAPTSGNPVHLVLVLAGYNLCGSVVFGTIIQTQRRRALRERAAQIEATTDPLTGLLNRRSFERLYQQTRDQQGSRGTALLLIDIDRFKGINDRFGHASGDKVLRKLAETLRGVVAVEDSVLRLGGEEFGVILGDRNIEGATRTAEKILDALRIRFLIDGTTTISVTVSIGMHYVAGPTTTLSQALKAADEALYAAKAAGRDRLVIGNPPREKVNYSLLDQHTIQETPIVVETFVRRG
jgi:diguanylate cyclase